MDLAQDIIKAILSFFKIIADFVKKLFGKKDDEATTL